MAIGTNILACGVSIMYCTVGTKISWIFNKTLDLKGVLSNYIMVENVYSAISKGRLMNKLELTSQCTRQQAANRGGRQNRRDYVTQHPTVYIL
jgi:hypothetical protein